MDGDLAATYVMIYSFLVRQSQTKVAESLKKSLRGSLIIKDELDNSGPSLDTVIKEWKIIKAAELSLKNAGKVSDSDADSDSSSSSSDSSSSSSDSDSDAQASSEDSESTSESSSSSSSSDSDSSTPPTKPEVKRKKSEKVKVAKKKTPEPPTPTPAATKQTPKVMAESSSTLKTSSGSSSSSDSDSDSGSEADTEEDTKTTTTIKKAVTFKKKSSETSSSSDSDSDSSSDNSSESEAAERPIKKRKTTENGDAVVSATQTSVSTTSNTPLQKPGKPPRKANVPFRRIDAEKVMATGGAFQDNGYENKAAPTNDYGAKAHQDLIVTRGAGFRKEKNKKKRGSYRGGEITMQVHSFKFDD